MIATIALITARQHPQFDWFIESLLREVVAGDMLQIVIIDFFAQVTPGWTVGQRDWRKGEVFSNGSKLPVNVSLEWHPPMPSVWQGPHRRTKQDWWAMSAARNTALCYAKHSWFLHFDDRCVIQPGFLKAAREHVYETKFVFGTYEKRTGVTCENGAIKHAGIVTATDSRASYVRENRGNAAPTPCPGEWYFGCVGMGPLEWYLNINGWDMTCDGQSMEDTICGLMIANAGYPTFFDHRMAIVEDRTPEFSGPTMIRRDKGTSPDDRSHAMLDMLKNLKRAKHPVDLRDVRNDVLTGKPFPKPYGPLVDFWDNQPLSEM